MVIGIVGYGRFGKLAEKIILNNFPSAQVLIFKSSRSKTIKAIKNCDIIIPSVPISNFENVIKDISPFFKRSALVIDVCSVKIYPIKVMKKYLPKNVEIIASHPLFGPDSASNDLNGLKIALWNVRASTDNFDKVKQSCTKFGLKVVVISPKEHDKYMAYSQTYTHLLGRIGKKIGIKNTPIDTKGFEQTLKIQKYVINDSWQLYKDMNTYNPFASEMRLKVSNAIKNINKELKKHQKML